MGRRNQTTNGARETRPARSNDEFSFAQGSHTRHDTGINDQRKGPSHKRHKRKHAGHEGHQQPGYSAHRRSVYEGRSQSGSSTSHSSKSVVSAVEESPAASESTAMEIPGFYFDPVKKKYFKITANHVFGSHHSYSQQSIKERTEVKVSVSFTIQQQSGSHVADIYWQPLAFFSLILRQSRSDLYRDSPRWHRIMVVWAGFCRTISWG